MLLSKCFQKTMCYKILKMEYEKLVPDKYKDKLPEVPTKGNLDIYMLKQSEFSLLNCAKCTGV